LTLLAGPQEEHMTCKNLCKGGHHSYTKVNSISIYKSFNKLTTAIKRTFKLTVPAVSRISSMHCWPSISTYSHQQQTHPTMYQRCQHLIITVMMFTILL